MNIMGVLFRRDGGRRHQTLSGYYGLSARRRSAAGGAAGSVADHAPTAEQPKIPVLRSLYRRTHVPQVTVRQREKVIAMANGASRAGRPRRQRSSSGRSGRPAAEPAGSESCAPGIADSKRNYERYLSLARAATLTGDAVEIQNHYQHAEHYLRLMRDPAS